MFIGGDTESTIVHPKEQIKEGSCCPAHHLNMALRDKANSECYEVK